MTITTRLYTALFGEPVGTDAFGNRYFRSKSGRSRREKRWVMYNGMAEPSKVPAEWHGWLHHTQEYPPGAHHSTHYDWQKEHLPNLTGTKGAYVPPGHASRGGNRAASTSDYQAWKP